MVDHDEDANLSDLCATLKQELQAKNTELEELRNLFRDGIIEPGDDVAEDWEEDGE